MSGAKNVLFLHLFETFSHHFLWCREGWVRKNFFLHKMEGISLEENKKVCYDCEYWHLVDPNCGGLVDIAVCGKRLIKVFEITDVCADFREMTPNEKDTRDMVRKELLRVMGEVQKDAQIRTMRRIDIDIRKMFNKIEEELD